MIEVTNYQDAEMENALVQHKSDSGLMLLQQETGIMYDVAIDVAPCMYTYIETEIAVPDYQLYDMTVDEKAEAFDILMGVSE